MLDFNDFCQKCFVESRWPKYGVFSYWCRFDSMVYWPVASLVSDRETSTSPGLLCGLWCTSSWVEFPKVNLWWNCCYCLYGVVWQTELEECTETLSQMISRPYLRTPRSKIVQAARNVSSKRHEFLSAVAKGLIPADCSPSLKKKSKIFSVEVDVSPFMMITDGMMLFWNLCMGRPLYVDRNNNNHHFTAIIQVNLR